MEREAKGRLSSRKGATASLDGVHSLTNFEIFGKSGQVERTLKKYLRITCSLVLKLGVMTHIWLAVWPRLYNVYKLT